MLAEVRSGFTYVVGGGDLGLLDQGAEEGDVLRQVSIRPVGSGGL